MTLSTNFSSWANNLTMRNVVKIQFKARDLLPKRRIGKKQRKKKGNLIKNLYVSQRFLMRTRTID